MHTTRREFFAAAASAALACAKPLGIPIGLQPYTLRAELAKDPEGILKQAAQMGYEAAETGVPFYGMDAAKTRALFKTLKLKSPSGFFPDPKDDSDWSRSIENAKTLGAKYMVTTAPQEWTKSLDGWKRAAERFNQLGEQTKKAGITVAYHNHNFEYQVFDGVVAYDEFLRSTDPKLVAMEMDIFWTTIAGKDPLAYFYQHPGRFPLWHIKDLRAGVEPTTGRVTGQPFLEIGQGTIDWKKMFGAARKAGLKQYYVEQDRTDRTPLESARMSADFLKKFQA